MKPKPAKIFTALITLIFAITFTHAQTTSPIDDYVINKMKDFHIPGLVFALIKDGKIAITKGYGYADVDKDIPYTPNTIQHEIASVSKIVTATAVMKLWEDELFQLDDPINNYLPFPVTNPFYPGTPITFRMLLSHTSSMIAEANSNRSPGNPVVLPENLGPFLQSVLVPGGSRYNLSECFLNIPPGSEFHYTNVGYTLLGYLVQQISGMPFHVYCDQNIFQPLCMNHTAWFFSQVDTNIVSRPYAYGNNTIGNAANHPNDLGLSENTNFPAGQVKTTIIELSKFILMHMNYGILDGVRIIKNTTEAMMRSIEAPMNFDFMITVDGDPVDFQLEAGLGINHFIINSNYNKDFFGWAGGGTGTGTQAWFNATDNTGIIVFANKLDYAREPIATADIALTLEKFLADTISTAAQSNLNCSWSYKPCEHSINYWTSNTSQWALSTVPMKLGTKHYYSKNQTLALLNSAVNSDASITLAKSLIAAKLNIAQGSELSPIVLTYNAAMNLIGDKRIPYDNPVSFSSATGIQMLALAATLDSYNSGSLNTTACSGDPSSVTRSNPVSEIDKAPALYSLSVFPNPASENVTISFAVPNEEKVSITIYDVNGRLIKKLINEISQKVNHNITWNTSNVNAGVYILKLQSGSSVQTRKLVVIK